MSLENKPLKERLKISYDETMQYANKTQSELLDMFIEEKLQNTLIKYDLELDQLSTYLGNQKGVRVLKALVKIRKQEDKKIIEQNMID